MVLRSCAASCRPVYLKSASRGNRRHSGGEIPPILAECPYSVVVRAMDACLMLAYVPTDRETLSAKDIYYWYSKPISKVDFP